MKRTISGRNLPYVGLALFLLAAALTALVSYLANRNLTSNWPINNPGAVSANSSTPASQNTSQPGAVITGTLQASPTPEILPTPDPWTGTNRVTILVMGLDYRDWETNNGPPRTDTMMLLTLDPLTMTAGMLSIPRDLWVDIPGYGPNKINTAFRFGELYKVAGGGPGLAVKTVEELTGVPVDYYAQIDFYAFEQFINEIGGVQVDVPSEIKVDPIGKGNTVILQPGLQTLDGPTALAYARNRKTQGGDFDRARRQQQVILAVRDKILQLNSLPRLVMRAPLLYAELSAGIHTNMSLEQVIQLAWLASQVQQDHIKRGVVGPNQSVEGKSPDNEDILIPIPGSIELLVKEVFNTNVVSITAQGEELINLALKEGASIRLTDASGVEGAGKAAAQLLRDQGFGRIQFRTSETVYDSTRIVDHSGNPYTVKYLLEILHLDASHIDRIYDPGSSAGIEIILGSDWARESQVP